MNRHLILTMVLLISGCARQTETTGNAGDSVQNKPSRERIDLNGPMVVIIQLDSSEIERLKEIDGEDNFYTGADDLMWYNSMLLEKMDSLQIPVKYTDKDTVDIQAPKFVRTIVKDTTFSLYTYFYFDGEEIKKADLFELLGE